MKRFLVILMSVLMAFCMIPAMGYAADDKIDLNTCSFTCGTWTTDGYTYRFSNDELTDAFYIVDTAHGNNVLDSDDFTFTFVPGTTGTGNAVSKPLHVGTYTLTVTGQGNYKGTLTRILKVIPVNLSTAVVKPVSTAVTYADIFATLKNKTDEEVDKALKELFVLKTDSNEYLAETINPAAYTLGYNLYEDSFTITVKGTSDISGDVNGSVDPKKRTFAYTEADKIALGQNDVSLTEVYYTGSTPHYTLTVKNGVLQEGIDYDVTINKNKLAYQQFIVTVTGKGDYAGTVYADVPIEPLKLNNEKVRVVASDVTKASNPSISVYYGSTLISPNDYTYEIYKKGATEPVNTVNLPDEGTYFAKVTGRYNLDSNPIVQSNDFNVYASSSASKVMANTSVTIKLNGSTVTSSGVTYTGAPQKLEYTVKHGDDLVEGTSFTAELIKPNNNKANVLTGDTTSVMGAGTYTLVLTGAGTYSGTKYVSFTVNPVDLSSTSVKKKLSTELYENYVAGVVYKPTPTVSYKYSTSGAEYPLTAGTDYSVSYANNTTQGRASVTLTGKGNYTGTTTLYFTIGSYISLTSSNTTITYTKAFVPTSTSLTTSYAIIDKSKLGITATYKANSTSTAVTIPSTSYDVAFYDDTYGLYEQFGSTLGSYYDLLTPHSGSQFTAGTYYAKVTFSGQYSGTFMLPFTVGAAVDLSVYGSVTLSPTYATYTGTYITAPSVIVRANTTTLTENTDYTVTWKNEAGTTITKNQIKDTGTYTVTVTGKGGYTGTKTAAFTVSGTYIYGATVTLNQTSAKYDGLAKSVSVTSVKLGTTTLSSYSDYTVKITNALGVEVTSPKEVGTYTVTVTGKGKYSGTATAIFQIIGNVDPVKRLADLDLKVRTVNETKGIKVYTVDGTKDLDLSDLTKAGYTVTYNFYNSTYNGNYKLKLSKADSWYRNTAAKKGSKYYYKVIITVKDSKGNVVAATKLTDCKYGCRTRK